MRKTTKSELQPSKPNSNQIIKNTKHIQLTPSNNNPTNSQLKSPFQAKQRIKKQHSELKSKRNGLVAQKISKKIETNLRYWKTREEQGIHRKRYWSRIWRRKPQINQRRRTLTSPSPSPSPSRL